MAKRPAGRTAAKTTPVLKKPRVDPAVVQCQEVARGIQAAEETPQVVREMLTSMLETSLKVYKDERHEFQQATVHMVGDLLSAVEAGLLTKVGDTDALVASADDEKTKREAAVNRANEQLAAQIDEVSVKKLVLADDAQAFRSAKEALAEVQATQKGSEKELAAAMAKKDELELAMKDLARPLIEGSCKDKEERADSVSKLMRVLKKHEFSDSMLAPLPNMLVKDPTERGTFDTMLASQVTEEANKRLADFDTAIEQAEAIKASHASVKHAADEKLHAAREAQRASAEAFTATRSEQKAREQVLEAAKVALKELGPQMRQNTKAAERAKESLAKFRGGPLATFEELRDRSAPQPAEAVPVVHELQGEPAEVAKAAEASGLEEVAEAAEAAAVEEA